MIKLIKLPLKLLALPLILILMAAALLVKLVTNLSAYVMGPLMLFILGCEFIRLCSKCGLRWQFWSFWKFYV